MITNERDPTSCNRPAFRMTGTVYPEEHRMLVYLGDTSIASVGELDRVVEFLTSFKQDFLKQTAPVHDGGKLLKGP
ncbi:MAG TPA: hypothetical protein VGD78_10580 [Chthoniobacterales bacterium]